MRNGDFLAAERICRAVGLPATLKLCAFCGKAGQRVYVPIEATPGHLLERLLGTGAFAKLVAAEAGEFLPVPELDLGPMRRAGMVYRLSAKGVAVGDIAQATGLSTRAVQFIRAQQVGMGEILTEESEAENV